MNTSSLVGLMSAVTMPTTLAVAVDQRTARVAGVDGGVDLDEAGAGRDRRARALERAVEPGDDARADRAVQAERVADDVRLAADLDRARVAQRGRHEVAGGVVGMEDRDVVVGLLDDDLGRRFRAVGERQLDRCRALDDVQAVRMSPLWLTTTPLPRPAPIPSGSGDAPGAALGEAAIPGGRSPG